MVVVVPESSSPPSPTALTAAFQDWIDLRTAVIEIVDNPGIADVFPRLLALAESSLNRTLRFRDQIKTATITFTDGVAALPLDFAEAIALYASTGYEYVQQAPQTVRANGCYYSIENSSLVSEGISGDLTFQYYASLPPLGETVTTSNWLLQRYPDIYLYAVGLEAAKYVKSGDLIQSTREALGEAIVTARGDDSRARYSRAKVRVAGVTP